MEKCIKPHRKNPIPVDTPEQIARATKLLLQSGCNVEPVFAGEPREIVGWLNALGEIGPLPDLERLQEIARLADEARARLETR